MKEVKKCSISGVAFTMDADAYQELENYLDSLKKTYKDTPDGAEIVADIEARIAELILTTQDNTRVVEKPLILNIIHQMGSVEDISEESSDKKAPEEPRIPRRLYRDTENAKLGGVCAGIGKYFDVDPVWIRLGMFLPILLSFLHWIPFMDWTGSMMGNLFGIFVICYVIMWFAVPAARTARQKLEMNGEKITAMFPIQEFADDKFLFFVTRQGIAKRIVLSDLQNIRRAGLRALNLNEDDALVDVRLTDGEQNILIATHEGKAICFDENEVRAMGRVATGVRGIKLAEGDYVIGAARARKDAYVLSITENGYGKRTPVEEFTVHHRGGGGMMLHNLTEKTGLVAGIAVVDSENDVMIITDDGVIIRTGVEEIRECGRGSQGVIVMRFKEEGDQVISLALTDREETAGTQETEEGDPAGERAEEAPISEENQSEEE